MRPARIASACCTLSRASTVYTYPCGYTVSAATAAPAVAAPAAATSACTGGAVSATRIAASSGGAARRVLDRIECRPQIRNEVVGIFDTDGDADQSIGDADP